LPKGENISSGHFTHVGLAGYPSYGILDSRFGIYQSWTAPGIGFVGFRFNSGAGVQYGWVRVRMSKLTQNAFTVLDYAYADPGEPISAGQRSSAERAPDQGSLGWLALGAAGLIAWRKSRSRTQLDLAPTILGFVVAHQKYHLPGDPVPAQGKEHETVGA
jgi:hypothetical protein